MKEDGMYLEQVINSKRGWIHIHPRGIVFEYACENPESHLTLELVTSHASNRLYKIIDVIKSIGATVSTSDRVTTTSDRVATALSTSATALPTSDMMLTASDIVPTAIQTSATATPTSDMMTTAIPAYLTS